MSEQNKGRFSAWSYLSILGAVIIWSSSFIAIKVAYDTFMPLTLAAVRIVLAAVMLGAIVLFKRERVKIEKRDLPVIMVSGLTGITLYAVFQNIAMQWTSSSTAVLTIASYPAITALLEALVYRSKPNFYKVTGIVIAICGVAVLSYVKADARMQGELLGIILLMAAGVAWSFYNFSTRKVVNRYPAVTLSFYQNLFGAVLLVPLALIERKDWVAPTPLTLGMLLFLAGFCSVVAFLLYNLGLRKLTATTAVTMLNLIPLFGVFFSYTLLSEPVTLRQLAGGAIIILGVMLSVKKTKAEKLQLAEQERPEKSQPAAT